MPYQLTKRQKKSFQGIFIGLIIGNLIFEAGKFFVIGQVDIFLTFLRTVGMLTGLGFLFLAFKYIKT